jgi:glucose/arabinose dehydrogenase
VLVAPSAFGAWTADSPGVRRLITAADLPAPVNAAASAGSTNFNSMVPRPPDAAPSVPAGFIVDTVALPKGAVLSGPRRVRFAPNGDLFVAQSKNGTILVLRFVNGAVQAASVFASNLTDPFGMAFSGNSLYVGCSNALLKYPYSLGDMVARGSPKTVLTYSSSYHYTRDLALSADGATLFVAVGSGSNVGESGAAAEAGRARVLAYNIAAGTASAWATGVRNPAGLTVHPWSGALWAAVNERDMLGDNVPFEYATPLNQGDFYGWPYYYTGNHVDPRFNFSANFSAPTAYASSDNLSSWWPPLNTSGAVVPSVLLQAHSAPLSISFYTGASFPADYCGDAFVALHGSWNRKNLTGYKVVRLRMNGTSATGEYDDFMTGFVVNSSSAWGRPVDVLAAGDGSILVVEDYGCSFSPCSVGGSIWRVTYAGAPGGTCAPAPPPPKTPPPCGVFCAPPLASCNGMCACCLPPAPPGPPQFDPVSHRFAGVSCSLFLNSSLLQGDQLSGQMNDAGFSLSGPGSGTLLAGGGFAVCLAGSGVTDGNALFSAPNLNFSVSMSAGVNACLPGQANCLVLRTSPNETAAATVTVFNMPSYASSASDQAAYCLSVPACVPGSLAPASVYMALGTAFQGFFAPPGQIWCPSPAKLINASIVGQGFQPQALVLFSFPLPPAYVLGVSSALMGRALTVPPAPPSPPPLPARSPASPPPLPTRPPASPPPPPPRPPASRHPNSPADSQSLPLPPAAPGAAASRKGLGAIIVATIVLATLFAGLALLRIAKSDVRDAPLRSRKLSL